MFTFPTLPDLKAQLAGVLRLCDELEALCDGGAGDPQPLEAAASSLRDALAPFEDAVFMRAAARLVQRSARYRVCPLSACVTLCGRGRSAHGGRGPCR